MIEAMKLKVSQVETEKEASEYGCGTVQIIASDMGVKLYTDFGFKHNDNFMFYKL